MGLTSKVCVHKLRLSADLPLRAACIGPVSGLSPPNPPPPGHKRHPASSSMPPPHPPTQQQLMTTPLYLFHEGVVLPCHVQNAPLRCRGGSSPACTRSGSLSGRVVLGLRSDGAGQRRSCLRTSQEPKAQQGRSVHEQSEGTTPVAGWTWRVCAITAAHLPAPVPAICQAAWCLV